MIRQAGQRSSGSFPIVFGVHGARQYLARFTDFKNVLAVLEFQNEFTFEDKQLRIELVTMKFGVVTRLKSGVADFIAPLTCQQLSKLIFCHKWSVNPLPDKKPLPEFFVSSQS